MSTNDPVEIMYAARRSAAKLKADQLASQQAEARARHDAAKAQHRKDARAGYNGSDDEFARLWKDTVEPEWQRGQLAGDPLAANVARLRERTTVTRGE